MGISGIIDGDGRIVKIPGPTWAESKNVDTVVNGLVPIDCRESLYARWGDWLPLSCWGVTIVALIVAWFRRSAWYRAQLRIGRIELIRPMPELRNGRRHVPSRHTLPQPAQLTLPNHPPDVKHLVMNPIFFLALAAIPGQAMSSLQVRNAVVERGEVKAGTPLSQKFELQNQGATPDRHRRRSRRLRLPEAPAVAQRTAGRPNGGARHRNQHPIARRRTNSWKTTVRYQEEKQPAKELELVIKAKIVHDITVEPVALSLSLATGEEATHTFTLTDRRAKPLTLTGARCNSKNIKTQVGARIANGNGISTQQVQVTILKSLPAGYSEQMLYLTTDDPEYRDLRLPISVMKKAPGQVDASPEQIDLRLAKGQSVASGLVRLRNPDDQRMIVDHIEGDHPALCALKRRRGLVRWRPCAWASISAEIRQRGPAASRCISRSRNRR